MNRTKTRSARALVAAALLLLLASSAAAEAPGRIELPAPDMSGGMPLMQALSLRATSRSYSPKELPAQVLGDLLWAATGVNRPESGKRTAPTARNWQQIDVYVAMADGLYRYDHKAHALELVLEKDLRAATGTQGFVAGAPVNLVFVADYTRMGNIPEEYKKFYAATDTGFVSQNVYLYCASAGLATVVRGLVEREQLAEAMKLAPEQHVVLAQTVGYPGK